MLTLLSLSLLFTCLSITVSADLLRVNGCPRNENKILIVPFSSGICEQSNCVSTGEAVLEQVAFSGCGNVTCSYGAASMMNKRSGQVVATIPRGGHGTCALTTATESIFTCSDEKRIIVTVDSKGLASFKSQGQEQEAPSAYFGSKVDQHGCYEPKLQDQSAVSDDLLHIDCKGDIQKKCLYDQSSS